jgi:hypothetical protein
MAKVIDHGWSKPSDQIAQPISIVMGKNLRKNSQEPSKPQKAEKPQQGRQEAEKPEGQEAEESNQ